jgi:hypothetical protein
LAPPGRVIQSLGQNTSEGMSKEFRTAPRKILRVRAILTGIEGSAPIEARTVDLSIGGLSITCNTQLMPGQRFKLSFDISSFDVRGSVVALVEVAYCLYAVDQFKAGLKFVEIAPNCTTLVKKFVAS